MKKDLLKGTVIPRFTYDTPEKPGCDFYALCEGDTPLVLVFLPNFGSPLTRSYVSTYLETLPELRNGRLACVVQSDPVKINENLQGHTFPFALICDAEGALYAHFGVKPASLLWHGTAESRRIYREAKREGWEPAEHKDAPLLPLTLAVGREGEVLFSHYGASVTDLPEDCMAIDRLCAALLGEDPDAETNDYEDGADEAESLLTDLQDDALADGEMTQGEDDE